MKRKAYLTAGTIMAVAVLMIFMSAFLSPASSAAKKHISVIATSKEGSAGFEFGLALQKVLNQYLKPYNIVLESRSSPGSQASQRMVAEGMVNACWQSSFDLVQTYQRTGPYKKQPVWNPPYLCDFPRVTGMYYCCLADRDDMKSLSDLAGKKVYVRFRGSAVHDMNIAMLKALGILDKVKVNDTLQPMALADGLKSGQIDVISFSGGFAGVALKADMLNVDTRCKIKYIPPTEEEKAKLTRVSGLAPISGPIMSFTQDIGTKVIWGVGYAYGVQWSNSEPADVVYRILKETHEHWEEVLKITRVAPYFGKDEKSKQLNMDYMSSLTAAKGKIHPGAAKFFKEVGWWKEGWPIGELRKR